VVALIAAGRLDAQHRRPEDARYFYATAQKSSVPHADWDETIRKGAGKARRSSKGKKLNPAVKFFPIDTK
jgi:hypothetical protein